jgi:hypothetical protein
MNPVAVSSLSSVVNVFRIVLVTVAVAGGACHQPPRLEHSHASASALAGALLDALHRRDGSALERVALDEREFRQHVWPHLPAARPERNLPFSYVWADLHQKSTSALAGTLARHGGRRYRLLAIEFNGETDYGPYRVHRETTLRVDRGDGAMDVRVCGSLMEMNGQWKVFSYVVE